MSFIYKKTTIFYADKIKKFNTQIYKKNMFMVKRFLINNYN